MCNYKLYHIHVNKLVQNVFFDFVKINALHMLIQVCLKFKMVYAYTFPGSATYANVRLHCHIEKRNI